MTFDEAVALPTGSLVNAVQPCDSVSYVWVRNAADRVQAGPEGTGRVMLKRPDNHPDGQFLYLFAWASQMTVV